MLAAFLKGVLIGLLGGVFAGGAMFLFLVAYETANPAGGLGAAAGLASLAGGLYFAISGILLGGGLGPLTWLMGIRVEGGLRGALFGFLIMAGTGALFVAFFFLDNPQPAAANPALTFGLPLVGGSLGGAVSGALVGALSRTR